MLMMEGSWEKTSARLADFPSLRFSSALFIFLRNGPSLRREHYQDYSTFTSIAAHI
jgi:hypothetical protein